MPNPLPPAASAEPRSRRPVIIAVAAFGLLLVGALAVVVFLSGRSADSPAAAVESFYGSVAARDFDKALNFLPPNNRAMLGDAKLRQMIEQQAKTIEGHGGIAAIKVLDEKTIDNRSQLQLEIAFRDSSPPRRESMTLEKVDGVWRMVPE